MMKSRVCFAPPAVQINVNLAPSRMRLAGMGQLELAGRWEATTVPPVRSLQVSASMPVVVQASEAGPPGGIGSGADAKLTIAAGPLARRSWVLVPW